MSASGTAIARFMIAELKGGGNSAADLLRPETTALMRTPQAGGIEPLNHMLLGFYESSTPGHRAIAHAGALIWSHTDLRLYVDDGVGIFVAFNSQGRNQISRSFRNQVINPFAERYLPPASAPAACLDGTAKDAQLMAGVYQTTRRFESSFASFVNLLSATTFRALPDGHLIQEPSYDLNGAPITYCEIGPMVWRNVNGWQQIAPKIVDGKVVRIGLDTPYAAYEPVPWQKSPVWLLPALIVSLVVILLTALQWPVAGAIKRYYHISTINPPRFIRASQISAVVVSIVTLVWLWLKDNVSGFSNQGIDALFFSIQLVTLLVIPCALGAAAWRLVAVWRSDTGWISTIWSVFFAMAIAVFVWAVVVFHLATLSLIY